MTDPETSFSECFHAADEQSGRQQVLFLRTQKAELALLVSAAVAANFGSIGLLVSAICFTVTIVLRVYDLKSQPDQLWWSARAVAETAKSLCWRYISCGEPLGVDCQQADEEFSSSISALAKNPNLREVVSTGTAHVTAEMRAFRATALEDRIDLYRSKRVGGQLAWYSAKSKFNAKESHKWLIGAIAADAAAITTAFLLIKQGWNFDAIGAFSAVGAMLVAWSSIKQFDVLSRSYASASQELAEVSDELNRKSSTFDERAWAEFVDKAERTMSREHTSWRASRGTHL